MDATSRSDSQPTDPVRPGIGTTGFVSTTSPENAGTAHESLSVDAERLLQQAFTVLGQKPFAILTGAGLSTDSGIPDYRGPNSAPRNPVTYQEFVNNPDLRRRYWARNQLGWKTMGTAVPNAAHHVIAGWDAAGISTGIITQNVDRLHEAAGASNVIDLHGRFDRVVCLNCHEEYSRSFIGTILDELNPDFIEAATAAGPVAAAPDADADLEHEGLIEQFRVPVCPACGGMLKPDFVFFGENVPKQRVEAAFNILETGGGLLVAGSSLTVMSGLRFVRRAVKDGKPVAIINRGQTRGDALATWKIDAGVGPSLKLANETLITKGA